MTKTFLSKYWLILTSACLISTAVALACAGDWESEYGSSNFTPEAFVAPAYSPFFYSSQFYYEIGHDEAQFTRFNNSNVREWATWLGKTVKPETIEYLLTAANPKAIDSGAASRTNDAKSKAFFTYLQLAKKCEAFSLNPIPRPWDDDTAKHKSRFNAATLNRQLQQQLTAAADPFLQQRYWFQLVRSQFFNGAPQDVLHTFDSYAQKFPVNTVYYRSLAYTAGAYYKLKQFSKANYYYSLVYQGCDELKTTAHYSFHPQEQADWQGTLALCRNNDERSTLWQMLGIFYSDPRRAIQEIYQLNPKSEKLDLLLSRAVNLIETSNDSSEKATTQLIYRIAEANNTGKPWIWQQAAGYLNTLANNHTAAAGWYTKADATTPKTDLPQAQLRLLKLYNTIDASKSIDNKLEQKLLPELQWLYHLNIPLRASCAGAINVKLAALYTTAGDKAKAECFVHKSSFYTNAANLAALKAFLTKPNPSPYERLCYEHSEIKKEDIAEYQAIQYTMSDHIDEALALTKEADSAMKTILKGNPFNARIQDCHDCDHEAPQKIKYSKADLIKKLKELKDKIAAGQDVYTNAILAGNAQYNITHFGNARIFYECKIYGSDHSQPWTIDSSYRAPLTSMKTAIRYYTLALGAAKDNEQKAKCQYLLAKCQRNEWYNETVYAKEEYYLTDDKERTTAFIEFDGFKALKQYAGTKYYNEVLKECGYFRTYTGKNH